MVIGHFLEWYWSQKADVWKLLLSIRPLLLSTAVYMLAIIARLIEEQVLIYNYFLLNPIQIDSGYGQDISLFS